MQMCANVFGLPMEQFLKASVSYIPNPFTSSLPLNPSAMAK